jgi:hypothetical protein
MEGAPLMGSAFAKKERAPARRSIAGGAALIVATLALAGVTLAPHSARHNLGDALLKAGDALVGADDVRCDDCEQRCEACRRGAAAISA